MKSKTSCYDSAVSHATLKRFAPLCLLYTMGIVLLTTGATRPASYYSSAVDSIRSLCTTVPICNLVYAALLAQLLMGDLYTPRLSYALYSLPVTLGGWFGTQVILGILSVLPGILISGGILALQLSSFRITAAVLMASTFLSFLFFFGIALLSSVCTGNRIGMLLIYGILNFGGLFYGWAKLKIFCPLIYGIYIPNYQATAVPIVKMISQDPYTVVYDRERIPAEDTASHYFDNLAVDHLEFTNFLWVLLAYAVAGCIVIGLAMYLLRRRKPECAGDLLAFPATAPVLLVLCSVLCGIFFHMISDAFGWAMGYPMLFIGMAVGYYVMLMLLRRQTNVFSRKSLVPLMLILLISLGGITATGLNLFGITYRIPDPSQVEEVTLWIWGGRGDEIHSSRPEDIALAIQTQTEVLDFQREIERTRPLLERIYGSEENAPLATTDDNMVTQGWLTLRYTLKNGKQIQRLYYVYSNFACIADLRTAFSTAECVFCQDSSPNPQETAYVDQDGKFSPQLLMDQLQGVRFRCYHGYVDELSNANINRRIRDEDISGLIDAILKDCQEGNMSQYYVFHPGDFIPGDCLSFYFDDPDFAYTRELNITLYADCTHTLRFLADLGYHPEVEEAA